MKHLLLAVALLLTTPVFADSPEAILKDYRKQAAQAVERLNQSLEKAATPIITKLVSSGDTAGAEQLTKEMKAKIAGESVAAPQASAVQLFSLYDEARAKVLAPVQKSSIARIDGMLKTAGGAKLETVTELGKVRAEIEAGKAIVSLSNSSKMMPALWNYYSDASMGVVNGQFIWNPEGTVELKGTNNNSTPGRWQATNNPNVFKVFFTLANKTEEECELRVRGKEAELVRPVGTRYLKAK